MNLLIIISTVSIAHFETVLVRRFLAFVQSRFGNVQCSVCTGAVVCKLPRPYLIPAPLVQLCQLVARVGVLAIYVDTFCRQKSVTLFDDIF